MQKMYSIVLLINGIYQHTEKTKNILFYSIGEAESYLAKWFENDDNNTYTILPTYRKGDRDIEHIERVKRITAKYTEL